MPKFIDLTGQRYGKLTALRPVRKLSGSIMRVFWECQCDCGKIKAINASSLKSGHTSSCGCITLDRLKKRKTHGLSKHRVYRVWYDVRHRCKNKNYKYYADYGGRGIGYDPRWNRFENFLNDMGLPPGPDYVLVRLDMDKNFEKSNCKWVSMKDRNNYKRRNHRITFNGVTKNLTQWSKETGISARTLGKRRRLGWSEEKTLTTPPAPPRLPVGSKQILY